MIAFNCLLATECFSAFVWFFFFCVYVCMCVYLYVCMYDWLPLSSSQLFLSLYLVVLVYHGSSCPHFCNFYNPCECLYLFLDNGACLLLFSISCQHASAFTSSLWYVPWFSALPLLTNIKKKTNTMRIRQSLLLFPVESLNFSWCMNFRSQSSIISPA